MAKSRKKTTPRAQKPVLTAASADKLDLYQQSVQWPEFSIEMIDGTFRGRYGRAPLKLREDFSGTALLCAAWVRTRAKRTATGVDLDARTLRWGQEHNIAPLGAAAARVRLIHSDVVVVPAEEHDVVAALNYSYCVFKTRARLVSYFQNVRRSLGAEGLFLLDCFGGQRGLDLGVDRRDVDGFAFEWEQARFNPIDHNLAAYIHFEFPDGTRLDRAFAYDWRHWSIPELRDALTDAGFPRIEVLWEGATPEGKGDGRFVRKVNAYNDPKWNAYLAAFTR